MPALLPIRTSETVRLVSPTDPAIDVESTDPEYWAQYKRGEIWDPSRLQFKGTERPTWFVVRALSAREKEQADHIKLDGIGSLRDERTLAGIAQALTAYREMCARFGLVAVEEETDSDPQPVDIGPKTSHFGIRCWALSAMDRLPRDCVHWLGVVIDRLSTLDPTNAAPAG